MAQAQTLQPSSLELNLPEPLATSLLSLHSFSDVAALVNSAQIVPPQFVLPEEDRPGLAHDAFVPDFDLPVFDLSLLATCQTQEERSRMAAWLSNVCKEWGFFQIVNHGVEPVLLKKMESFGRTFFELQSSTKEKVEGYKGKFDPLRMHSERWSEAVNLGSVAETFRSGFLDVVWPDGNKEFSDCFERYVDLMEGIAGTIFELLIESLGVKLSSAMEGFGKGFAGVRYNYYPPCPQPSLAMGLGAHTDPNVLTILFQDEVGGLQLRGIDGEWRAVKPKSDAFVVNVGDIMKVLSNGAYRTAEHRAVLNSMKARLSLGFFYSPHRETIMKPLEDLVDAQHPAQFKPFNYGEYIRYRIAMGKHGNIHAFAGMSSTIQ